jgi:hypothetical protein
MHKTLGLPGALAIASTATPGFSTAYSRKKMNLFVHICQPIKPGRRANDAAVRHAGERDAFGRNISTLDVSCYFCKV